jgi:hypothetical protein
MLRGTTSARVAIEPLAAPVERPTVRNIPRAKEIPAVAPVRVADVEKPAKGVLMKSASGSAVLARATPEAAKFAAAPPKAMSAKDHQGCNLSYHLVVHQHGLQL